MSKYFCWIVVFMCIVCGWKILGIDFKIVGVEDSNIFVVVLGIGLIVVFFWLIFLLNLNDKIL